MTNLINTILSSSYYTTFAVILILFLLYFLIKKLFKLVIYGIIIFFGFLAYVHFTGDNVKNTIEKTKLKTENALKKLKKK